MKLRPIFVDVLPEFDTIKAGELWISHKYRTVNLRCPCGCGDLTVLSLHLSVSNSSSGRRWKLDHAPAVGDPTHMVEFGTGRRAFAREA